MLIFYKKSKKYNEIQLTKNKMDLNIRKMTNHPLSPNAKNKAPFRLAIVNVELMHESLQEGKKMREPMEISKARTKKRSPDGLTITRAYRPPPRTYVIFEKDSCQSEGDMRRTHVRKLRPSC